jgi:hypothetical protein
MAKYNIEQRSYKDVQSGRTATSQSKAAGIRGTAEPKRPGGSKVNLSRPSSVLMHERIAERAWVIWQNRGCSPGEDERNWLEAEAQLREELDID